MSHLHRGGSWRKRIPGGLAVCSLALVGAVASPAFATSPEFHPPTTKEATEVPLPEDSIPGLLADYFVLNNTANDRDPIRIGDHKATIIERDINTVQVSLEYWDFARVNASFLRLLGAVTCKCRQQVSTLSMLLAMMVSVLPWMSRRSSTFGRSSGSNQRRLRL